MDNIMDNQWNLGLNLTLEEYETDNSTSDDFQSNFDWKFFHERGNFKMMSLILGMCFGMFWPVILLILIRLVGYAVIGLTFGYGREFVNATFFQWSDEFIKNFDWLFSHHSIIYPFIPSFALGCILGSQFGSIYVELHANFLEKSNMTWAEILVEKQAIDDNEFISQIITIVLLVFILILGSAILFSTFCPKRRNGSEIPLFNEESQTPNSNQESQTPNSNQESQTPDSNQEYQNPNSNQESQTPNSDRESQTPISNQESQTPNSNQESQTNEESIPIRTDEEYHTIWVDNLNF